MRDERTESDLSSSRSLGGAAEDRKEAATAERGSNRARSVPLPPAPLPLLPHSSAASGPSRAHGPAESEAITKVMGEDVVRGRKKTNCERLSPKLEFLPLARLARLPVVRSIQEWRALTVSRGPPFFSAPVLSASASFLLGGRCQRTSSSTMNSGRCGVHPSGPPREERRGGKGGCDTRAHPNARWRAGDRT